METIVQPDDTRLQEGKKEQQVNNDTDVVKNDDIGVAKNPVQLENNPLCKKAAVDDIETLNENNPATVAVEDVGKEVSDQNTAAVNHLPESINQSTLADPSGTSETIVEDKLQTREQNEDSEDEGIEIFSLKEELNETTRDQLYTRGCDYELSGKKKKALQCYLYCIKGLQDSRTFPQLPQCLRKVADIYFEREEFEKAVQFIQAEKIFYETALLDTSEMHKKLTQKAGHTKEDEKVLRAEEYENLAKICLEKKQPQLALEYQGKATKILQEIFGDNNPKTSESLDLFTVIYGEVGKLQYSESLQKATASPEDEAQSGDKPSSPASILRQRNSRKVSELEEKKKVRFEEPVQTTENNETQIRNGEGLSSILLWTVFGLCLLGLYVLGMVMYCKTEPNSRSCAAWRADLYYYFMRFKYLFYHYFPWARTNAGPVG